MQAEETVFEKTYKNYLEQIDEIDFESVAPKLGGKTDGSFIAIPFFGREYRILPQGITGPSGETPAYDVCVVLCKHLLRCPDESPVGKEWVSFRDLKDSAPLINYFTNEVEDATILQFSGKVHGQ